MTWQEAEDILNDQNIQYSSLRVCWPRNCQVMPFPLSLIRKQWRTNKVVFFSTCTKACLNCSSSTRLCNSLFLRSLNATNDSSQTHPFQAASSLPGHQGFTPISFRSPQVALKQLPIDWLNLGAWASTVSASQPKS